MGGGTGRSAIPAAGSGISPSLSSQIGSGQAIERRTYHDSAGSAIFSRAACDHDSKQNHRALIRAQRLRAWCDVAVVMQ
jgi:hypothetical protein